MMFQVLAWGVCADNIVGAVVAKVGTEVGATKGLGTTSFTTSHPTDDLAVVFGKVGKWSPNHSSLMAHQ